MSTRQPEPLRWIFVVGFVLLCGVTALISYQVGRARSKPAQAGERATGSPSVKSEADTRPSWIGDYQAAGSSQTDIRAGRSTEEVLGALRARRGAAGDHEAQLLLASLEPDEIEAALAVIDKHPEPSRTSLIRTLLSRWSEFAPQLAIDYALANYQGTGLIGPTQEIAGSWARHDPAAALEWYREQLVDGKLPNVVDYGNVVARIVYAWGAADPDAALAALLAADLKTGWWPGFAGLAESEEHRQKVIDAVSALADDAVREVGLKWVIAGWARVDPRGAASWLDEQELLDRNIERAVTAQFARLDPPGYADWMFERGAKTHPDPDRNAARLLGSWADTDPDAAGAWLAAKGIVGEQSIGIMVESYTNQNIEKAIAWAERADESARDELIINAIAAAAQHGTIENSEIGTYATRGSLSVEEMEKRIHAALEQRKRGL